MWTVANLITISRILLIAPFLYFVQQERLGEALAVFVVAGISDGLDGWVARRYGQYSTLGRFLDPLADKLLTTASFVFLALPHRDFSSIPVWLAISVVARDVIILLGSLAVYLVMKFTQFKPTFLGKVNTILEIGLVIAFLTFHAAGVLIGILPALYVVVGGSVLVSGIGYLLEGVRIARVHRKAKKVSVPLAPDNVR